MGKLLLLQLLKPGAQGSGILYGEIGIPLRRVVPWWQVAIKCGHGTHAGSAPGLDVAQVVADVDAALRPDSHFRTGLEQWLGMRLAAADLIRTDQACTALGKAGGFQQRD